MCFNLRVCRFARATVLRGPDVHVQVCLGLVFTVRVKVEEAATRELGFRYCPGEVRRTATALQFRGEYAPCTIREFQVIGGSRFLALTVCSDGKFACPLSLDFVLRKTCMTSQPIVQQDKANLIVHQRSRSHDNAEPIMQNTEPIVKHREDGQTSSLAHVSKGRESSA